MGWFAQACYFIRIFSVNWFMPRTAVVQLYHAIPVVGMAQDSGMACRVGWILAMGLLGWSWIC
jgi:hypothetical protein